MTDGTTYYNKDSPIYLSDCSYIDGCSTYVKMAKIELYTALEYDHDTNSDGQEITVWGMEQQGKMLPGEDNPDFNGSSCDYENNCRNFKCNLDQNWRRSELTNLENAKYKPGSDKTTSLDTSYTVGTGGVSVTASVDHPKLERKMDYQSDDYFNGTYNFYWGPGYWDDYKAARKDSIMGQVSTWTSDRPSDGDDIAPTYQYGEFKAYECDESEGIADVKRYDTTLFEMFTWPIS